MKSRLQLVCLGYLLSHLRESSGALIRHTMHAERKRVFASHVRQCEWLANGNRALHEKVNIAASRGQMIPNVGSKREYIYTSILHISVSLMMDVAEGGQNRGVKAKG